MSAPTAVLFDFSDTLFRFELRPEWFDGRLDAAGRPFDDAALVDLMRRVTHPVGAADSVLDDDEIVWEQRDLDRGLHRRAYQSLLRGCGLTPDHAVEFYDRIIDPASWCCYADTEPVLRGLHAAGIKTGVVSNIAFDIRQVFERFGWLDLVDAFALSYEVGAMKPDPQIFRAGLDKLGVDATAALMVGDSESADGGAVAVGMAFELVPTLPVAQRPTALRDALARRGLALP